MHIQSCKDIYIHIYIYMYTYRQGSIPHAFTDEHQGGLSGISVGCGSKHYHNMKHVQFLYWDSWEWSPCRDALCVVGCVDTSETWRRALGILASSILESREARTQLHCRNMGIHGATMSQLWGLLIHRVPVWNSVSRKGTIYMCIYLYVV